MADNIQITQGTGTTVRTTEVDDIHHQHAVMEKEGGTPVSETSPMPVRESWRITLQSWTTANDSDVLFTVPADMEWQIEWIFVIFAASATAGTRQLAVELQDASNNEMGGLRAGVTQAENQTRRYMIAPGVVQDTAFRDTDYASVASNHLKLSAGQKIRIFDNKAVAPSTDDFTIRMQVIQRSIA